MILPPLYLDFVRQCKKSFPASLLGTDFAFTSDELKKAALEILAENQVENFLTEDDFVFFDHQGYVFGYFKADGSLDPDVHIVSEGNLEKNNMGPLSRYLFENYIDDTIQAL